VGYTLGKSIVFIGFMGAGKTTVGKLVAEKLNRTFIDTDDVIEQEFGMPASEIFKTFGEHAFRDREKGLIIDLCSQENLILSLGGGAFLQEEIRQACLTSCTVIFLDLTFENWQDRVSLILDTRPVLKGKTLEEMKDLFNRRQEIYAFHHIKMSVDHKTPVEISNQILKRIGKTLHIKNLTIGEGNPKICVSLTGKSRAEIIEEAKYLNTLDIDLVEWRADFFSDVEDLEKVQATLVELRGMISNKPLIFTFRSKNEGGEKDISTTFYFELNKAVVETKLVDLIDIELFNEESSVKAVAATAHAKGILVIISNHDFMKTPAKDQIISRLRKAQDLGADIPKIAVMPTTPQDVLTLLDATTTMNEKYAYRPIITMSMGSMGAISRVSGSVFGSAVTFGAARKSSAPGQIDVGELRRVLKVLNN
jgi:3-dehydroquinate dehydratase type I